VEVAALIISCLALLVSIGAVAWPVWTWLQDRRCDVRAHIEQQMVQVASGKFEITVVIENPGGTDEAVHTVRLLYSEHVQRGDVDAVLGPPSLWDRDVDADRLPNRHKRRTYNLLAAQSAPIPNEVTARVLLESGKHVVSEPFKVDSRSLRYAAAPSQPGEGPLRLRPPTRLEPQLGCDPLNRGGRPERGHRRRARSGGFKTAFTVSTRIFRSRHSDQFAA
jgi:hypothetical protein